MFLVKMRSAEIHNKKRQLYLSGEISSGPHWYEFPGNLRQPISILGHCCRAGGCSPDTTVSGLSPLLCGADLSPAARQLMVEALVSSTNSMSALAPREAAQSWVNMENSRALSTHP